MERSQGSWAAYSKTAAVVVFAAVSILYVAVGAAWSWRNLGHLPPYGDIARYRFFTDTLTIDHFHGALYPLILSLLNPWKGNLGLLQLFQFGLLALCLAYFLHALRAADFARPTRGRRGVVGAFASLLVLLLLDPLLAHFCLSVMQDSLALSGCLAFSAALAELTRDGARRWVAVALLFAGFFLAAGVRIEKSWVLLATLLATLPVWLLVARGYAPARPAGLLARGGAALAVALLGFASAQWLHASMYREPPRTQAFRFSHWPKLTTILHQRIVYPNLTSVYDGLSPDSRAMLTRSDAQIYDRRIHNTWSVTERVTRGDPDTRDRLTRDLASTALRSRWASIAADVASDTAENVFAPASFYLRLASWSVAGADPRAWARRFEATPWTYHVLSSSQPRLSRLYLSLSGILFVFAGCLAILHARELIRSDAWKPTRQTAFAIVPVALLCVANAFAFSLSANLVHPRYTIFAHAAGLLLVYRGAFAWVFRARPGGRRERTPLRDVG